MRVGLVGAGFVSPLHVRGWRLAGAEVVGIVARTAASARDRARELGIPRVYADVTAMLEEAGLDVLDIAAPPATHRRLVEAALARGVAVMCQKPLADDLQEARAIAELAATAQVPVMVHENWRFRPWYRTLRRVLDDGELGEVFFARFSARFAGTVRTARHPDVPYSLRRQPFFASMRPLLILESVIHQLDVARFLFGEPESVYARTHRISEHVTGEDCALVVLGYAGRTVEIDRSYASKGYPEPPVLSESAVVEGRDGSAFVDRSGRLDLARDDPRGRVEETRCSPGPTAYEDSYAAAIAHFCDALRTGGAVETTPRDNLRTLGLVFAAYRSAETGRVIAGGDLADLTGPPSGRRSRPGPGG